MEQKRFSIQPKVKEGYPILDTLTNLTITVIPKKKDAELAVGKWNAMSNTNLTKAS